MLNEKIESAEKGIDVGEKAARSVQSVPIGWMFVIMMAAISLSGYIVYKAMNKSIENCEVDKDRMMEYFVFKSQRQSDTINTLRDAVIFADSTIREQTQSSALRILKHK